MKKNFIILGLVIFVFLLAIFQRDILFFKSRKMEEVKKINFITKDGVTIVGNYYPNREAKYAGILIHQRPATKESFDDLASFLRKEGYALLAIDLRGHGESTLSVSGKLDYNKFTPQEEQNSINDLEGASLFLEKEGFPKSRQFLIGASIGANLSFQFLSENPEIKAVVLLSPGLNYRGIILERFKKEGLGDKIFIVSALDDSQAVEGGRTLKSWYSQATYIEYPQGGHGTNLFKTQPDLKEKILFWLREKLID